MLPKYFEDLHLAISCITGKPRIVSAKTKENQKVFISEKYKDIPKNEWEGCILSYCSFMDEKYSRMMIKDDWSFFIGGNPTSKEKLIQCLKNRIKEIEEME